MGGFEKKNVGDSGHAYFWKSKDISRPGIYLEKNLLTLLFGILLYLVFLLFFLEM